MTAAMIERVQFGGVEFAIILRSGAGVDTRMHEQPVLRERGLFAGERYPVTGRLVRRGLYLPSGLKLGEAEIDAVCAAVRKSLT